MKRMFKQEDLATLKFGAVALVLAVVLFFGGVWSLAGISAIVAVLCIVRLVMRLVSGVTEQAKKAAKTISEVANPVVVDDGYVCTSCGATFQLKTEVCPHCGGRVEVSN